ncbi:UDP-3-O-acyl-N-acetylglucosamine deacetylase, partial [Salmonella enterica]|uniref:UDP-3-O-acyl-N-acetylglucosamine deacetylase n=1 Tax=Salmonella enterica TaxID=28901 RepID=UPI00139E4082
AIDLDGRIFERDLARARTFGFLRDVERLWKAGFALGASLDNTVALDEERVLNPEGLRWPDEFVRHKTLDAVGDLALAGSPIIGAYRSFCGGHKMNVAVLAALFADKSAFEFIELPTRREAAGGELRVA